MKHKHADLIKQWADGAKIQARCNGENWIDATTPCWATDTEYRIKPLTKYYVPYMGSWIYEGTTPPVGTYYSTDSDDFWKAKKEPIQFMAVSLKPNAPLDWHDVTKEFNWEGHILCDFRIKPLNAVANCNTIYNNRNIMTVSIEGVCHIRQGDYEVEVDENNNFLSLKPKSRKQ
jgi:hypothetical protein